MLNLFFQEVIVAGSKNLNVDNKEDFEKLNYHTFKKVMQNPVNSITDHVLTDEGKYIEGSPIISVTLM